MLTLKSKLGGELVPTHLAYKLRVTSPPGVVGGQDVLRGDGVEVRDLWGSAAIVRVNALDSNTDVTDRR